MLLQCDFDGDVESVLPPLESCELCLWWKWCLWLLRSGDKKQYGFLLVIFVPSSFSDPVIMPWRSPSKHLERTSKVPADSQHQLPIGMRVSSPSPQITTPPLSHLPSRGPRHCGAEMLSFTYPFQTPDPKNLKMAIVLHAMYVLACYTTIVTLPKVASRYMETGIWLSILMPGAGSGGENRSGFVFCLFWSLGWYP